MVEIAVESGMFFNPGDGVYRMSRKAGKITFNTLTVMQKDPDSPLAGVINLMMGNKRHAIDLSAGDRWFGFANAMSCVDAEMIGVGNANDPARDREQFTLCLS